MKWVKSNLRANREKHETVSDNLKDERIKDGG